jgi:hypothetical protein
VQNSHISQKQDCNTKLENQQLNRILLSLRQERIKRTMIMSLLVSALLLTIFFGTIENPFQYTFSKIGNRFTVTNRILFIVWAAYTGFSIQTSVLILFQLECYDKKRQYIFIHIATVFLIISALSPSLDQLVFWTKIHLLSGGLFALFLSLGFTPFILWLAQNNPILKKTIYIWLTITWGGGITWYFLLGNTGMFEIWFFGFFILFLLYLSLHLFEKVIISQSINLLSNSDNNQL